MAITKEFADAVKTGRKTRVRIMLKDIMLVDPSLESFAEMLKYAEQNISDLYDQHDGEPLNNSSAFWTEDYMNQQMVLVVSNFSRERIDLLSKIVKNLYGQKEERKEDTSQRKKAPKTRRSTVEFTDIQKIGAVITAVGVGVAAVGTGATIGGCVMAGGLVMVALGGNKE